MPKYILRRSQRRPWCRGAPPREDRLLGLGSGSSGRGRDRGRDTEPLPTEALVLGLWSGCWWAVKEPRDVDGRRLDEGLPEPGGT